MLAPNHSYLGPWFFESAKRFNGVNDETLGQESDRAAIRQTACQ
jgi:hypothetical protein